MNCKKCKDEDVQLMLVRKITAESLYNIDDDGNLEFYDNRSVHEEIFLECPECGATFEQKGKNTLLIEEVPTLKKIDDFGYSTIINKKDLKFK
jgi:uncharacterized Zn finger protein